jgi:hypothetical protein
MIVRWSLADLPDTLAEVAIRRPYIIASERWRGLELPENAGWWSEVPSDGPEVPPEADGILAVGGGSAIDMGKYASAQSGLPVVHVPTTYSGAEWTTFYGIRSPDRRIKGGGAGATPVAIVYDVELTLLTAPKRSTSRVTTGTPTCRRLRARGSSRRRCRAWSQTAATAMRARSCRRERCTRAARCHSRGSRSGMRWPRRSAVDSARRTAR